MKEGEASKRSCDIGLSAKGCTRNGTRLEGNVEQLGDTRCGEKDGSRSHSRHETPGLVSKVSGRILKDLDTVLGEADDDS